MAKARSPQYPAIGLKEAIEKVTAVYNEDYQNPISRAVAVAHMGYQSLNGKSLGVLSALLKYGLLEGRGDDTRVSDLAVSIIAHQAGTPERGGALKEAASKPDLFNELDSRFQGGKVSDQALRSYLLTQKFIPIAADAAIRSYRETKQVVDTESMGYTAPNPTNSAGALLESMKHEGALVASEAPDTMQAAGYVGARQTVTISWIGEKGVSESSIAIKDDRLELAALLYDQTGVQKVIDRLTAMKALLPEQAVKAEAGENPLTIK